MTSRGRAKHEDREQRVADTVEQVLAYQAGDDAVREDLFRRYRPRVLTIVRARMGEFLKGREDPEDIAQQTLMSALEDLKTVRLAGQGALINWLARVAENVIRGRVDYYLAKKRDPHLERELQQLSADVSSGQFRVELASWEPDPAHRADQRETLRDMLESLREMQPEYREVILLRRIAGCSPEYTAEKLQRSVGAVNMLASRAEARLAALMAKRGHSDPNSLDS